MARHKIFCRLWIRFDGHQIPGPTVESNGYALGRNTDEDC